MDNNIITVYGVHQTTGEYKKVFNSISLNNWITTGKVNALNHKYNDFRFFKVGNISNRYKTTEIFLD